MTAEDTPPDGWLDEFYEAVRNLKPGDPIPEQYRANPTAFEEALNGWSDELGELFADKLADPIAFVRDEAKLVRQQELIRILRWARQTPT